MSRVFIACRLCKRRLYDARSLFDRRLGDIAESRTSAISSITAVASSAALEACDWQPVTMLADELLDCARTGRQVFLAGNGGSAGNAVHLANDFLYAWSKQQGRGIRVNALPANTAIMSLPCQ